MCGITGIYNYNTKDVSDIEFDLFVDSLKHRGPDGRGTYKDKDVFCRLGHRRLSILDLSDAGIQPLSYFNERYWITFNGEIYNFIELKEELKNLGYSFKTNTDSEVILASFLQWKEDCQLKFNGMWAFAIWDSKKKELFLSRDRFGVKPLYYYIDNNRIVFSSETKSFWHLECLNISFDPQMITNVLHDANIWEASEKSLIKNINRLKAGHCFFFSKHKGLKIIKWWETVDHLIEVPKDETDVIEQFKQLFYDSCNKRMRSDVPIGNSLSGGLDSSSVVCAISQILNDRTIKKDRILNNQQQIFSAIYPNTSQDESIFAQMVSKHIDAKLITYEINEKKVVDNIDYLMNSFGEIFDLPIGPWLIYKQFRENNCCISIDGHGADELLGGYHHQVNNLMNNAIFKYKNYAMFKNFYKTLSDLYISSNDFKKSYNYSYLIKDLLRSKSSNNSFYKILIKIYSKFKNLKKLNFNSENIISLNHSEWLNLKPQTYNYLDSLNTNEAYLKLDDLNQILYQDFHYKTLPVILRNFDSCSMAHGVEIRSPFLDWRLVSFVFSLNQNYKIDKGFTKLLLRNAMKGIIPDDIRIRKNKIGFANPIFEWIGSGLKPYILDNISSQSFLSSSIWNGLKIKKHVENCYKIKNYKGIYNYWLCIIANNLIESSQKKVIKN
jgi:asparagine synthase (glutamine-hydrolysing)